MVKEIVASEEFFELKALHDNKLLVLDCFTDWCGPCKVMAPIFEQLSNEHPNCRFAKMNIEKNGNVIKTIEGADQRAIAAVLAEEEQALEILKPISVEEAQNMTVRQLQLALIKRGVEKAVIAQCLEKSELQNLLLSHQ